MGATTVASGCDFLRRIGTQTGAVVGVGSLARGAVHLAASRDDADRALRVLRGGVGRAPEARGAHIDDVQVETLLQQLGDVVVAENRTVSGPLARLAAYDRANQADMLATLRAWLDAFGDVAPAADALPVHPDTLRYRLRRLAQLAQLDLGDSDARFGLMLQRRLIGRPCRGYTARGPTSRRTLHLRPRSHMAVHHHRCCCFGGVR